MPWAGGKREMDRSAQSLRVLTVTLLSAMVPLLAAALCLGAYLNFASVRANYFDLVSDRIETVSRRIAADAQMALSLGLPLGGQTVLERLLEREKETDPGIARIEVVGSTGRILFSTDAARKGTQFDHGADGPLKRDAPIASPFGTVEGTVVTEAGPELVAAAIDRLFRQVLQMTLIAFGLGVVTIGVLILFSVRAMGRRVMALSRTARGRMVPTDMVATIDEVDEAHDAVAARLEGRHAAG